MSYVWCALTLLSKSQEALTSFSLWYVKVLLSYPAKQSDPLREYRILLQIIGRDGLRGYQLRRECTVISKALRSLTSCIICS
jgi:hypothetical protein